jgi:uncharacterized protein (DUF305 family)
MNSLADKNQTNGAMAPVATSPADADYATAMHKMMMDMMAPLTGKADLDFVQGMIPHHQGAIDMANAVLKYGKDQEVKKMAEGVVSAQESEITLMKAWLAKTDQAALPVAAESRNANEQAMAPMMMNMGVKPTGDADVDFMAGMIPHHQGAIDMAKVELKYGKDPELLKLAGDIISAQEGEIAFMTAWLQKNGK